MIDPKYKLITQDKSLMHARQGRPLMQVYYKRQV